MKLLSLCFGAAISLSAAVAGNNRNDRPLPPNLILFFPDTLRAESIGTSFYNEALQKLNVTPNFDALANQGTTFSQAHAMHTQCGPSRCTMLTGRYMHVLGHRTQTHLIQAYEENYFRLLKEAGYHVAWYGKNDALSEASFNLSVSEWRRDIGYDSGRPAFEYGQAGYWSMLNTGGRRAANDTANGDFRAVKMAREFLLQVSPPEPFLLFLATRGAHPPYGSPPEFQEKWTLEQIKQAVMLRPPNTSGKPDYHSSNTGIPHYRNLTTLSEDTFYEIQRSYLQMISYADYTFGVLMDGLKKSGLEKRTAVFVSSDHGDFAGDYHLVEKWPGGADDVLTRVPLIARIPGGAKNHVSDAPVQTADILETMLSLANVTSSYVRFGRSLLPVLRGAVGDRDRYVYSEGGFSFHSELFPGGSDHVPDNPKNMYWPRAQQEMSGNGTGSPKWIMIRNTTSKLVLRPKGVSELYYYPNDPKETKNLFNNARFKDLKEDLLQRLTTWLVQTSDVPPMRIDSRDLPACPSPITSSSCDALLQPDPDKAKRRHEINYFDINGVDQEF